MRRGRAVALGGSPANGSRVALMSKRSLVDQLGAPKISNAYTSYAKVMSSCRVACVTRKRPGRLTKAPSGTAPGTGSLFCLTVATSNLSVASGTTPRAWADAVTTPVVRAASITNATEAVCRMDIGRRTMGNGRGTHQGPGTTTPDRMRYSWRSAITG